MKNTIVSIILTTYNHMDYIKETIESVLSQRYKNWELLIGDDSQDDDTWNIIQKYIEKYPSKIKAWHHKPNKGIVSNMSFLLGQINKDSQYVAFLEGDDCLFPNYLESKIEIFEKYHNVKLVYNELSTVDSNSNIITKRHLKNFTKGFRNKGKLSYEELINDCVYISWSSLMVRTEMVKKFNICPPFLGERNVLSDIFFFYQIAHNEDIFGIKEPLIYYRLHNNSITGDIKGKIMFHLDFIAYEKYLYENGEISENFYKNHISKGYLMICLISVFKYFSIGKLLAIKNIFIELFNILKSRSKSLIK